MNRSAGLIAVWGKEAVQFLDGLVTNSVKDLEDGNQMLVAFPDAKGRLIAVVRVLRQGDRFLFETEATTREAVHQNLFDLHSRAIFCRRPFGLVLYFEIFGPKEDVYHPNVGERFAGVAAFELPYGAGYFIPNGLAGDFHDFLTMKDQNDCQVVDDELYEVLRIESGIPKYGIDMDETTVVPSLASTASSHTTKAATSVRRSSPAYTFAGHVAKQLIGIVLSSPPYSRAPAAASASGVDIGGVAGVRGVLSLALS